MPTTRTIWTCVNERDGLGDDLVPDYATGLVPGGFYGWPYSYIGGHPQPGDLGKKRPDLVAVYLPQSYNFAGQVLLFPADQVTPISAGSSDVMAFIVSGGVVDGTDRGNEGPATPAR